MPEKSVIVIDASPLRGMSGERGIGRYIRDLLYGLEACRDAWDTELELLALHDLDLKGQASLSRDLCAVADQAFAARGSRGPDLKWARRLHSDRVGHGHRARLLHFTEPLALPWTRAVPQLVTCHDLIRLRFPELYLAGPSTLVRRRLRERLRLSRGRQVVAISRRTKADLVELLGIAPERCQVIDHGIDLSSFTAAGTPKDQEILRALGVPAQPYLVFAGHADARKNVAGLLDTLARVRRTHPVRLAWAGSIPKDQQDVIRRQAAHYQVAEAIDFLGFVAEDAMPVLFRQALAHVFLSRLEGFGLSVVEAMAAGCPVIVARNSASDEVAGAAGKIVDADDSPAAAQTLLTLLADEGERSRMRQAGIERARYFDRTRMARDYVDHYRRLLKARPS